MLRDIFNPMRGTLLFALPLYALPLLALGAVAPQTVSKDCSSAYGVDPSAQVLKADAPYMNDSVCGAYKRLEKSIP